MIKYFILLLLSVAGLNTYCAEDGGIDGFIIEVYSDNIKVISPKVKKKSYSVILKNRSLITFTGKYINLDRVVAGMVRIRPQENSQIVLDYSKNSKYFFMMMSPGLQEVELSPGKEVYEIPAKK